MCSAGVPAAGGAAGAAAAAIAQAIKASGVLVNLTPEEFQKVLDLTEEPLVVVAEAGWRRKKLAHLMSYKGLAFYTKSRTPLEMPLGTEVIIADRIWIPG